MVDQMTPMQPSGAPVPNVDAGVGASGPMSARRRLTIIVAAVVAFLVVAGAAAFAVFFFLNQATDEVGDALIDMMEQTQTQPTAAAVEDPHEPSEPGPVALNKVFTFRNIFVPLAVPPDEDDETTVTPTGDSPTAVTPTETLYLSGIVSFQDGHLEADLEYESVAYMLREGDRIPNTPWQVLSIGSDTVVMLYGDTQVTLTAGQSVSK